MALITYGDGSDKILHGTSGTDSFVVDLALLADQRTRLVDLGGTDSLRLLDASGTWATVNFINTGTALIWKGAAGGRVVIPLAGGTPGVEFVEWRETADAGGLRLRLVTDLTPDSGGNIAIIGSGAADQIIVPSIGGSRSGTSLVYGGGGDDAITGSASEYTIVYGGRGADLIITPGPAAGEFYGGKGKDVLWGCSGQDQLYGGKGKDDLLGFEGRDRLEGGRGPDSLKGGAGADKLFGGKGRDTLYGADGNDQLTGGKGRDSFVFDGGQAEGRNTVRDFKDGADTLTLEGVVFGDLEIGQQGGDTWITLSLGTVIVLKGMSVDQITVADFDFI